MGATTRETLAQTKLTNGRVNALEVVTAEHGVKVRNLEREVFDSARVAVSEAAGASATAAPASATDSTPITRRDLAVFGGAIFVLVEVVRWIPAMFAAGKVAP